MEIALPILGTVLISGATTCFAINKERNQKRFDVGGDQLKQLFEEYDEHIQYLHNLKSLAKTFNL
jgi:Leucine-rich repeat (LRR) protein